MCIDVSDGLTTVHLNLTLRSISSNILTFEAHTTIASHAIKFSDLDLIKYLIVNY